MKKLFPHFLLLSTAVFFVALLPHGQAQAQPALDGGVLSAEIPSGAEVVLSKKNVSLFHEMLLAPLASWIKEGRMYARVVRELSFSWELSKTWNYATTVNAKRFSLNERLELVGEAQTKTASGYPFGFAADIKRETDPARRAVMILWNSVFAEAAAIDPLYGVELSWIGFQSLLRQSSGVYYRQYSIATQAPVEEKKPAKGKEEQEEPAAVEVKDDGVLMREVLKLFSPAVVYGFAHLTHRYREAAEDVVWMFSPVVGRSRQIISSNRSDPLLGGTLSPDDLFVLGNKVQSVNARVVDEKVLLVPFPSLEISRLESEEVHRTPDAAFGNGKSFGINPKEKFDRVLTVRGSQRRRDNTAVAARWNYETRRFPYGTAWVPTSVVFVPRMVWILEVTPRDPYNLSGRQVVVVDQETMLPVYKIVYDRKGRYQKTVMAGWGLASSDDGQTKFPYCAFVLAVGQGGKKAMALTTRYVRSFQGQDVVAADAVRRLLDISAHEEDLDQDQDQDQDQDVDGGGSTVQNPDLDF